MWRFNNVSGHIINIVVDYDEGMMKMARKHRALTQISISFLNLNDCKRVVIYHVPEYEKMSNE